MSVWLSTGSDAILKAFTVASAALLFAVPSARPACGAPQTMQPRFIVLVFSKTDAFRHKSIPMRQLSENR